MKVKNFLAIFLSVLIILSTPYSVSAVGNQGNISWELNNGTLYITGTGDLSALESKYGGYPWDKNNNQIVAIDISEGITKIGPLTFNYLDRLQELNLPDSIVEIGNMAFSNCENLKHVKLPRNLQTLGYECFSDCYKIEDISFPDSLKRVGSDNFEDTEWYKAQPDGCVYVGKVLYTYKGSLSDELSIKVKNGTIGIADRALSFSYGSSRIKKIDLPSTLEYIGNGSFSSTGITDLKIPNSVVEMGTGVCLGCESLERITLPNNISEIPDEMFERCLSLKTLDIPYGVQRIGTSAFWSAGIEKIVIPNTVSVIERYAFYRSSLSDLTIGIGVKSIGETAFDMTELNGCKYVGSESSWKKIRISSKGNDYLYPVTYLEKDDNDDGSNDNNDIHSPKLPFIDANNIIHATAVGRCVELNIISGYPDGSYKPTGNITRAQMCKMICTALNGGKDPVTSIKATPSFTDIDNHWAEGYIEYCYAKGIVSGIGNGKFNPNGNVTGTQAAKMLLVSLGYNAKTQNYIGSNWSDNVNAQASKDGLYNMLSNMNTEHALSRDNAAQMIWNTLQANVVDNNGSSKGYTLLQKSYGISP